MSRDAQTEYVSGRRLSELVPEWADEVAAITKREEHLLPQIPDDLRKLARDERFLVAVSTGSEIYRPEIVGFCALWPLKIRGLSSQWYEFGTVYVDSRYRHHAGGDVTHQLYVRMLGAETRDDVLATTTSKSAIKAGLRTGMLVRVRFDVLPPDIARATCVCPQSKTGAENPMDCPLRDKGCFLRVTASTHRHLGSPPVPPFPML